MLLREITDECLDILSEGRLEEYVNNKRLSKKLYYEPLELFSRIYKYRILKQWILSLEPKRYDLKKKFDNEIRYYFNELNNNSLINPQILLYFFNPHRITSTKETRHELKKFFLENKLLDSNELLYMSDVNYSINNPRSRKFSKQEITIGIEGKYSYQFKSILYKNLIHNSSNINHVDKMLMTDGNIPSDELIKDYAYIWVINGLHYSEMCQDKMLNFIYSMVLERQMTRLDVFIGFKDILRDICNPLSQFSYKNNKQWHLESNNYNFQQILQERGINIKLLNFDMRSCMSDFTDLFDIWGYKYNARYESEYFVKGKNLKNLDNTMKVTPFSHSFEYKLAFNKD